MAWYTLRCSTSGCASRARHPHGYVPYSWSVDYPFQFCPRHRPSGLPASDGTMPVPHVPPHAAAAAAGAAAVAADDAAAAPPPAGAAHHVAAVAAVANAVPSADAHHAAPAPPPHAPDAAGALAHAPAAAAAAAVADGAAGAAAAAAQAAGPAPVPAGASAAVIIRAFLGTTPPPPMAPVRPPMRAGRTTIHVATPIPYPRAACDAFVGVARACPGSSIIRGWTHLAMDLPTTWSAAGASPLQELMSLVTEPDALTSSARARFRVFYEVSFMKILVRDSIADPATAPLQPATAPPPHSQPIPAEPPCIRGVTTPPDHRLLCVSWQLTRYEWCEVTKRHVKRAAV